MPQETFTTTSADMCQILGNANISMTGDNTVGRNEAGDALHGYMRLLNVSHAIPQGAIISNAQLVLNNVTNNGTTVGIKINAEYRIDPKIPVTANDFVIAPMGAASFVESPLTFTTNYSFDITDVIQEIVNHPDWIPGCSLALHVNNNASTLGSNIYYYFTNVSLVVNYVSVPAPTLNPLSLVSDGIQLTWT